jgi:hypothetical protein
MLNKSINFEASYVICLSASYSTRKLHHLFAESLAKIEAQLFLSFLILSGIHLLGSLTTSILLVTLVTILL